MSFLDSAVRGWNHMWEDTGGKLYDTFTHQGQYSTSPANAVQKHNDNINDRINKMYAENDQS